MNCKHSERGNLRCKTISDLILIAALLFGFTPAVMSDDSNPTINKSGTSVTVSFPTTLGHFYQFQSSQNLSDWANAQMFIGDGAPFAYPSQTIGIDRKFFRYSSFPTYLLGEWVSYETWNLYHMVVQWSPTNSRFEGVLTTHGERSAWAGFTIGELVWTATPTTDPKVWIENQKDSQGANGVSTSVNWFQRTFTLTPRNSSPQLVGTRISFARPGTPIPSAVSGVPGEWESQVADNHFRIHVEWNSDNQAFEGYLTVQGTLSAIAGFTIGELVWIATPTPDPAVWMESQKYRTSMNGVSTGFSWGGATISISNGTSSNPQMIGTSQQLIKITN